MSDLIPLVINLRDAANAVIAAAGGAAVVTKRSDPMTDPLDEDGVWRPAELLAFNDLVLRTYPEGYLPTGSLDFQGNPRRNAISLYEGFYVPACQARPDLTDHQRAQLHLQDNHSWLSAGFDSSTQRLFGVLAYGAPAPQPGVPGKFIVALHRGHTDFSDLPRLLANTFAPYGVRV